MAPVAMRRFRVGDDDDDLSIYDPYWLARGKKIVRDGCAIRTSVMLMDAVPNRLMLHDASLHRPHQCVVDSADPNVREVERAYEERSAYLRDAWKSPTGQMQQPPDDEDGDDDLSPRDRYIQHLTGAWKAGPRGNGRGGNDAVANAVQGAFIRTVTPPGSRPGDEDAAVAAARARRGSALPAGVTLGPGPAKDAANDPDAAYAEMCDRISNGWRR